MERARDSAAVDKTECSAACVQPSTLPCGGAGKLVSLYAVTPQ